MGAKGRPDAVASGATAPLDGRCMAEARLEAVELCGAAPTGARPEVADSDRAIAAGLARPTGPVSGARHAEAEMTRPEPEIGCVARAVGVLLRESLGVRRAVGRRDRRQALGGRRQHAEGAERVHARRAEGHASVVAPATHRHTARAMCLVGPARCALRALHRLPARGVMVEERVVRRRLDRSELVAQVARAVRVLVERHGRGVRRREQEGADQEQVEGCRQGDEAPGAQVEGRCGDAFAPVDATQVEREGTELDLCDHVGGERHLPRPVREGARHVHRARAGPVLGPPRRVHGRSGWHVQRPSVGVQGREGHGLGQDLVGQDEGRARLPDSAPVACRRTAPRARASPASSGPLAAHLHVDSSKASSRGSGSGRTGPRPPLLRGGPGAGSGLSPPRRPRAGGAWPSVSRMARPSCSVNRDTAFGRRFPGASPDGRT